MSDMETTTVTKTSTGVTRVTEMINVVNYLSKQPRLNDECYYVEDSYAVKEQTVGFRLSVQSSNQEN